MVIDPNSSVLDRDVGHELGDVCSTLAGLLAQGERAMASWISDAPRGTQELGVAREALQRATLALDAARDALSWVEEALVVDADTPPASGDVRLAGSGSPQPRR